jgi:hypothetical protein
MDYLMKRNLPYSLRSFIFMLLTSITAQAQVEGVHVVFMEPIETSAKDKLPSYQLVSAPERVMAYIGWMTNESARMAMDLYKRAWRLVRKSDQAPVFHIALVKEGNHPALGFRLQSNSGWEERAGTIYIKLDPDEQIFNTTLLHETGHIILFLLNGNDGIPSGEIASIPHTTAALTDRGTAFNEGFSIHLETLAAHFGSDAVLKSSYHHQSFLFGIPPQRQSEYYRQSMDLLSYAQTRTRYYEVRENNFAFAPAFRGPDYLRVQLEKSRDFASLRDANQLLQSEGFYATFFFSLLVRGSAMPTTELVRERQDKVLAVLAEMFRSRPVEADAPYLLYFIETFMQKYPSEAGEIVDVLLDLSHGVFVDSQAAALWREHYLGALRLDLAERNNEKLNGIRLEWRTKLLSNPQILYSNIGAQIRCEVSSVTVKLVAFDEAIPLSFDVNTVEEGIIRMIPGIIDSQVKAWLFQRGEKSFKDIDDFKQRSGLSENILVNLKF